ncbi:MAG: hypothetical protein ACJ8CR_25080 [Roseiflexaceae bacterium]
MAAITCLHPYQSTRFIVGELDAFLINAEHRRDLSATTLSSYRCDLLNAIAATSQSYRLNFAIVRETRMRADEVLSLHVSDVIA